MGRKPKYSEEVKIQACKDYEECNLSFKDISKKIGVHPEDTVDGI